MTKQLTVRAIENLRPRAERYEVPAGLIPGLTLVIQPTDARSWALRYRLGRTQKKLTLGTYPSIDLKTARDLARAALVDVAKGGDPAAEKKIEKQKAGGGRDLVENVVEEFIKRHSEKKNGARHIAETRRILTREVVKKWKGRRLGEISAIDVQDLLNGIADRGAPVMANRTLSAFRKLCNWAAKPGNGYIVASPCEGVDKPAGEDSRERILSDGEIKLAWSAFEKAGWPFGEAAKLLLLTAARRDEVAQMTWGEVDLKARTWIIPASRCKNKKEHLIPLSAAAVAILEVLPRVEGSAGFIFTTTGASPVSGFSKAKKQFDKLIAAQRDGEPMPAWTLHDLRRTAASNMSKLKFAPATIDAVLNHKSGEIKGVRRVYDRYDYAEEKRAAVDAWAQHVGALI